MLAHVRRLDVGGGTLAEGLAGHRFVLKKSGAHPQGERAEQPTQSPAGEGVHRQWQLLHTSEKKSGCDLHGLRKQKKCK